MSRTNDYRSILDRKIGERDKTLYSINNLETEINKTNDNIKYDEKALAISQAMAQETQNGLIYHIGDVVSLALNSVLNEPCDFVLDFVTKANRTQCEMSLIVDGEKMKPYMANGGGVVDLTSFALRIALWNLYEGRVENILILDEPLKWLDRGLLSKASEMLRMISKELKIQILMVTHIEELKKSADRIFEVIKENKVSEVTVTDVNYSEKKK